MAWHGFIESRFIIVGIIESGRCFKQLSAAQCDGWAPGDITPLPDDYWEDQDNGAYLLFTLIAVGVLATCLHPGSPLPVEEWQNDAHLHNIVGPEVARFFALLTGTGNQADGSLLDNAAIALRRIRESILSPKDLIICHFRLLNALYSGEWGKFVGESLTKIVAAQWLNVSENQRFALTSPSLYAPVLKEKCEDVNRDGFSKVASILKTAAMAAGVSLADNAMEFLTHVERGGGGLSSTD